MAEVLVSSAALAFAAFTLGFQLGCQFQRRRDRPAPPANESPQPADTNNEGEA